MTVLVDELGLPDAALAFGLAEAERRGVSLVVAQFWSALHEEGPRSVELLASRQEMLSEELIGWRDRAESVGVIGELLLDDTDQTLARLRSTSQLIVVPAQSAHLGHVLARGDGCCPTAVVPGPRPAAE